MFRVLGVLLFVIIKRFEHVKPFMRKIQSRLRNKICKNKKEKYFPSVLHEHSSGQSAL